MSDPLASTVPITWAHKGREYTLAPRTLDAELLFSARHAAWGAGELDRIRDMIGERSYETRVDRQERMRLTGKLAFGSALSFEWLLSDEGFCEYADLLMGEAGKARVPKESLLKMAKAGHPDFGRLWREVMRRDFPTRVNPEFLAEPPPPSAAGATPPPSTPESTPS